MEYIVYKITNKETGKYYIGLHECECWETSKYYGSGTRLKEELRKHGKEKFDREILFKCDTKQEMIAKEKEIVTDELISDVLCLNMVSGGKRGKAGFGFKKRSLQRKRNSSDFNVDE